MSDDQPTPLPWRTRLVRWAFDRPLRQVVIGIGLVLLLLTAPFGGWRAAPKAAAAPVVELEPGQKFTAGPLEVTLDRAVWNPDPAKGIPVSKVGGYLMVLGTVRSSDPEMVAGDVMNGFVRVTDLRNLVKAPFAQPLPDADGTLQPVPVVPAAEATYVPYSAADATALPTVGYGLTYEIALIFETKGSTPPTSVTLQTYDWTWHASKIDRQFRWHDQRAEGRVTLPVTTSTKRAHAEQSS